MGREYGAPLTELTIMQIEPMTASGMPFAVTMAWGMTVITPLSGAPAAPGDSTTVQPMDTGDPGIAQPALKLVMPAMEVVAPLRVADPVASTVTLAPFTVAVVAASSLSAPLALSVMSAAASTVTAPSPSTV